MDSSSEFVKKLQQSYLNATLVKRIDAMEDTFTSKFTALHDEIRRLKNENLLLRQQVSQWQNHATEQYVTRAEVPLMEVAIIAKFHQSIPLGIPVIKIEPGIDAEIKDMTSAAESIGGNVEAETTKINNERIYLDDVLAQLRKKRKLDN